jgi:transposase
VGETNDEGLVQMSAKERERLVVVRAVGEGRLRQGAAAERLGVSVRQVKRLVRAWRDTGARGLVSKRRGRTSARRIDDQERQRFIDLVRQRYADFGPTLAAEHLREHHGFAYSHETLRSWMIEAGLWRSRPVRRRRVFQLRERCAAVGELVQIDGSPHAWLEDRGPRCTLIIFVDDASSALQWARFEPAETTRAYLRGLREYVTQRGVPLALYSDRHSIFGKHDPEDPTPTQFERAARALGIDPILALTPQAKGRVERAFQTLQDRWVKALRLAGCSTLEQANAQLPKLIALYNRRFAKPARQGHDAHRTFAGTEQALSWACSEQYTRTLSKSLSCQFRGELLQVQTGVSQGYHLRGAKVTICEDATERSVTMLHKDKPLEFKRFERHELPERHADDKTLELRVEQARQAQRKPPKPYVPGPNHPWKRALKQSAERAAARS